MLNRGFRYGDGFFESIRTTNGFAPLLAYHFERIQYAMDILQLESDKELTLEWLESLVQASKFPNHIIRIYFYRKGEGTYAPINNTVATEITTSPTDTKFWIPSQLNLSKELHQAPHNIGPIGIFPQAKPIHPIFTIKCLSSAYYVLASKYKVEQQLQYAILTDESQHIIEEVSSNLIFQKGNELYTPPIDNGCVIGATLRYVLQQYDFQLNKESIKANALKDYDAIYSCKATTGIQRIA